MTNLAEPYISIHHCETTLKTHTSTRHKTTHLLKSNYYLIAGLLVIIGILALVALCVCLLNFKRLLNVLKRSDGEYHIEEHATELQEVHPLTTDSNRKHSINRIQSLNDEKDLMPPTYRDATMDGTSV